MSLIITMNAEGGIYSTADPGGADVELRESLPTAARGDSTEIASRILGNDEYGRNSVIYLKFGVDEISATELLGNITVRTTFRNPNLTAVRIEDIGGGANTGFDYYVMDPTLFGADWDEATITPMTAPAYHYDGDFKTKGTGTPSSPTTGLTYLGTQLFDSADLVGTTSPHLLVGSAFDLVTSPGSPLHSAIMMAKTTKHRTVTVAMGIAHDWDTPNASWVNMNYLFNPKEIDPLRPDSDSPYSEASNANGEFAPALITIPEPSSIIFLVLAGGMMVRQRQW